MIKPEPICSISFACLFVALTACGPQPPELDRADGASTQSALSFETEPALQSAARARLDPRVRLALSARSTGQPNGFSADARFDESGRFPVYVRFAASGAPGGVAPELPGVEWGNGAEPLPSGAYLARLDETGLGALEADPAVLRVESGMEMEQLQLDAAAESVRITPLRRKVLAVDGTRLDGSGRLIADIDSDAFVFHPGLFRADAGAYAWLDVDNDGHFVPGVDLVDIDRNGVATPEELAHQLLVQKVNSQFAPFDSHSDFRSDEDFLFLDSNSNGERDYGEGFTEATPAYGEPLFVADDANGNGVLDPSERVLRLGTSVFQRIRDEEGAVFVRGASQAGIIDYGRALVQDTERLRSAAHGTMMCGILAGGPYPGHRWSGMAPGADVVLGAGRLRPEGIAWALKFAPDAISMPFSQHIFSPLDGSSELEQLVDSVMKSGSIPVVSAGNSAIRATHAEVTLPVGSSSLSLTANLASSGLYISVLSRRPVESLALSLKLADGTLVDMPSDSTSTPVTISGGGRSFNHIADVSNRGTFQRHIQLWAPNQFPAGTYTLNATLSDGKPLDVHVYSSDDYRYGFTFNDHATVSSTIGSPATADDALTVTGYSVHEGPNAGLVGPAGQLADFAARGPRIDGFHNLDLAAPVNPLSTSIDADHPHTATQMVWPGTSCSAPIVVGAIALLRQLYPHESAESIRQRILSTASKDAYVSTDVDQWGQGKLDLAAAAGIEPSAGTPPTVQLELPASIELGQTLTARVVVTDDGVAHRTRWDVGYDGNYDTEWLDSNEHLIEATSLGPLAVRVETHDEDGYLVGATATVNVLEGSSAPPHSATGSAASDSSCAMTGRSLAARGRLGWLMLAVIAGIFGLRRLASGPVVMLARAAGRATPSAEE